LSLVAVVLLLALSLAWPWLSRPADAGALASAERGLPWQVRADGAGGSEVFGLSLGRATLADVQARWGHDLVVALIAAPGQAPALEAYVEGFQAGYVTGKLVLAVEADPAWLARARGRSTKSEVGEGAVRRSGLTPDDLADAMRLPLAGMGLLPSARLDEAVVTLRFGAAAERLVGPTGELHLLYPVLGVAVALPPAEGEGARARSLIQYVAPRDFERRLRQPLQSIQSR
jgi:hypothetical protein